MNVSPSCAQSYYHSSHLSKQPELFSTFLERKTGFSSVVTFSRQSNRLLVENRRWVYIISSLESTPGSFCQPHEHQSCHFPIHLRMPVRPSSSLSPLSCIHNVTPITHSSSPAWKRTSSTDPSCHHHRLLVPFGLHAFTDRSTVSRLFAIIGLLLKSLFSFFVALSYARARHRLRRRRRASRSVRPSHAGTDRTTTQFSPLGNP